MRRVAMILFDGSSGGGDGNDDDDGGVASMWKTNEIKQRE